MQKQTKKRLTLKKTSIASAKKLSKKKVKRLINLYFQDDLRFGLFTRNGKSISSKAVKPVCKFQQVFQSMYLFEAYSPITGTHFDFEFRKCNGGNFRIF